MYALLGLISVVTHAVKRFRAVDTIKMCCVILIMHSKC